MTGLYGVYVPNAKWGDQWFDKDGFTQCRFIGPALGAECFDDGIPRFELEVRHAKGWGYEHHIHLDAEEIG